MLAAGRRACGATAGVGRGLGRHVPRRRPTACCACTAGASACRRVHRARPGRHGRPDGPDPRRPRLGARRSGRFPRKETLAAIYSRMVNAGSRSPGARSGFPWCLDDADEHARRVRARTRRASGPQNVLDYDDLLLYWRRPGPRTRPRGPARRERFDHVLVDEYQDTNALQADILDGLRPPARQPDRGGRRRPGDLRVPGGDRAQHPRLPDRFAGAEVVTLEQNYRSTPPILDATNA